MWFPIFLVGGFWFIGLVILACIALLFAIETDSPWWAGFTLIGFGLAMFLFGNFNVFSWIASNPLMALTYAGGYFVAGAVWSVGKWAFYVSNLRDKYNDIKRDFIKDNNLGISVKEVIPLHNRKAFATRLQYTDTAMPEARQHKSRILTWMTYWPWSMLWTLINDPLRKMFNWAYRRLQRLFEKISERQWRGVEEDLDV